jgi:hypothetical protein
MTIQNKTTGTTRDKTNKSFVISPSRGEPWSAQEVVVGNSHNDPIPVDPTSRGSSECDYNEVSALGDSTVVIINKTIIAGEGVDLNGVFCSGDNIAHFIVEINGQVKFKGRTYWSSFNLSIDLNKENLVEGDNVKIIAENKTNKTSLFNATLKYNRFDL